MPFEGAKMTMIPEVFNAPSDSIVEDCKEVIKSLRSILSRKKSRSFATHAIDDAAVAVRMNRNYGYVNVRPAKLNDSGHDMLGPDWEAK
ncbi:MAG: hypothetical protein H6797_03840 [Candidatus Nomurabacteria bacterium]|nr:MAG: hypothetical protein H6797_03840 [Candidatus Nomurabacteria bacterium]